MRFFLRNKDEARPIDAVKQQRSGYKISMTDNDYSDMRQNTVTLKVWLSESVEERLGELTSYLNTSLSDFIRQILFQHLYGRYDLIGLVERDKYDSEKSFEMPLFSPRQHSENTTPSPPPKKVAGIKIFIPEQMKKDLEALAGAKHQTISEYVRTVILTHLFGVIHPTDTVNPPLDIFEDGTN